MTAKKQFPSETYAARKRRGRHAVLVTLPTDVWEALTSHDARSAVVEEALRKHLNVPRQEVTP